MMPEADAGKLVEEMLERFGLPRGSAILDPFNGTGTTILTS
jgi:DNA modification methylase